MSKSKWNDERALLEHSAWLRTLARSLVQDINLADDLEQETYVAALERPPQGALDLRSWLSSVMRNLLRQRNRSEANRAARERAAARPEAPDEAADVLRRALLLQELAQQVMQLADPFRTTILMRFFEGLLPRQIAAQLGIPVATVNSRLQRGLRQLRARMDATDSDDHPAWAVVLLTLPHGKPGLAASSMSLLGALLMSAKTTAAIAAILLGLGGTWGLLLLLEQDDPTAATRPAQVEASAGSHPLAAASRDSLTPVAQNERVLRAPADGTPEPQEHYATLEGRVFDARALPLSSVAIAFSPSGGETPGAWSTTSDSEGVFSLRVPQVVGSVRVTDPEWTNLMAGHFDPDSEIEPVVVVAPRARIQGEVRDDIGLALPDAQVELRLPPHFFRDFEVILDGSRPALTRAMSGATGRFDLEHAFLVAGSTLVTTLDTYQPDEQVAPRHTPAQVRIYLQRPELTERSVRGEVLDPERRPVAGAWVSLGEQTLLSDDHGVFRFEIDAGSAPTRLVAIRRGNLPGSFEPQLVGDQPSWPSFVQLVLGQQPASLAGRVLDARGDPRAGVRVWVDDPEWFGSTGEDPGLVEYMLSGAVLDEELEAEFTDEAGQLDVDAFLAARNQAPSPTWGWVKTKSDGSFELPGLLQRSYRVAAFDMQTLARAVSGPFLAGHTDLVITLPAQHDLEALQGSVRTSEGEPVQGASVASMSRAILIDHPDGSSTAHDIPGPSATTDVDGHFDLGPVARPGLRLWVTGADIRSKSFRVAGTEVPCLLVVETLEAPEYAHVQVELEDPAWADAFSLLDAREVPQSLTWSRVSERRSARRADLAAGRSEVLGVKQNAIWIVFYSGGEEVARYAIRLEANTLNALHY